MSQKYILVDRTSKPGKNGVTMWRFTFYNLDDGTYWECTADATYKNWRRGGWDLLSQDPCPWGVYNNLHRTQRTTKSGLGVVSADYHPQLLLRLDDHDQALDLAELNEQEIHPPPTNFGDLFQ
jgi:hypothetical protein